MVLLLLNIYILINLNIINSTIMRYNYMKNEENVKVFKDEAVKLLDEYSVKALNIFDDICKRLS